MNPHPRRSPAERVAGGPGDPPGTASAGRGVSRRRWLALAALLLGGCTHLPVPGRGIEERWAARQRGLSTFRTWTLRGRLALRTSEDAWTAGIRWMQRGDEYRIRLSGFLGQGAVDLHGRPGTVELRTAEGAWRAGSPESLLHEHTGFSVPLRGLRYWVLGTVDPGVARAVIDLDAQGRPLRIFQSNWQIAYRSYVDVRDLVLPERLDLEGAPAAARLAVSEWIPEG